MSEETKTHYRKVFKSDHLGVADLEDLIEAGNKQLIFTIKEVKQEIGVTVAGKKGNHNIAYFIENIKPLVLNATNSKTMKTFNGGSPWVEDWCNTKVQLYIDPNVKMKGDIVGGVRINPKQPALKKELTPDMKDVWQRAVQALRDGKSIEVVKERFIISESNQEQLVSEAL